MSTQREVFEGQTGTHRAKRASFGRGVLPWKFSKTCIENGAISVIPELYPYYYRRHMQMSLQDLTKISPSVRNSTPINA